MKKIIEILNIVRLGLFGLGYGIIGALMGGTLNRIMVVEVGLPLSLVGLFFAVPLFVTPIRVWIGYRSDGYVLFGKRREPYMIIGAIIIAAIVMTIILLTVNADPDNLAVISASMIIAFLIYGFGRNLAHNTFQALIADKFSEHAKKRAITVYEVVTLLGLVMGAGGLGKALEVYEAQSLITVGIGAVVILLILTVIAVFKNEPDVVDENVERAKAISFVNAVKQIALANSQIKLFFVIIMFTIVGTLAQDVVLEPYGGLVLNMEVGETTRLTQSWGMGIVISMLLGGLILVRYLGFKNLLRIGLILSALSFIGVIFIGMNDQVELFSQLVFLMGLGTGIAGAGMLSGFVTLTTAARAGFLMGIWGFANVLGRSLGSLMGGIVVDSVYATSQDHFIAYSVVFVIEIIMLLVAFGLTFRLGTIEIDEAV